MRIWCEDFRDNVYTDAMMRDMERVPGGFMLGRSLIDHFPNDATMEIRSKRKPADFFWAGSFPVVSLRLKKLLDEFGVQAEYLRVKLVRRDDSLIPGDWFCFNVIEVADCFDRSQSKFKAEQDYAGDIEHLVINESACRGSPLVLAKKTFPGLWIVRDDVADAIKAAGCDGVLFKRPEDWRDPVNPVT